MRPNNIIATAFLVPAVAWASTPARASEARIQLTIADVSPAEGQVRIATFCSTEAYRALKATSAKAVSATAPSIQTTVLAQAGACVILVHHDVDANGKLTLGVLGIPSEPTAASNNARGVFGPPAWKRAAVPIAPGDNALTIRFGAR